MTKKIKTPRSYAGPGNRQPRGQKRGSDAKLDMTDAYRAVFTGKPSEEQRDMVLVDLAVKSGFYTVAADGANLQRHEGRREVFGYIYAALNMTPEERYGYEQAVRDAHLTDLFEGEI